MILENVMERPLERLCYFINRVASDVRLRPTHTSLYLALCSCWIISGYPKEINVTRGKLMRAAHIQSIVTYHKVLSELKQLGYIQYVPSFHPIKGSVVKII